MFEFVMGEPSEEQKAEMQRIAQMREMAMEEGTQRVNRFLDSLDAEQLGMLKSMMNMAVAREGYAVHMIGWIGSLMHYKHDVCPGCGNKHNTPEELMAAHENNTMPHAGGFHGE